MATIFESVFIFEISKTAAAHFLIPDLMGMMLMRFKYLIVLSLLLMFFSPTKTLAHPLDMYGFGPRAVAMGGAYTAVADDYSALYYNIGGLSHIKGNSLTSGFMYARPLLNMKLNPAKGLSRRQVKELNILADDQENVDDVNGYFFGVAVKPHPRFAVGMGAYLPEGLVVRLFPIDARVPTFVLHEHRSQRVVTMLGASVIVVPSLSIGGGIRLFLKTKGYLNVPLEANNDNLELRQGETAKESIHPVSELKLDFPLTTYPFFGIHYQPTENLRFGVSYQYLYTLNIDVALKMDLAVRNYTIQLDDLSKIAPDLFPLKTVIELNIPELGDTPLRVPLELSGLEGELTFNALIPIEALVSIQDLWKPQSVNFGAAYDPIDALTLSLDVDYFNWAAFPSPNMKLSFDDVKINLQTLPATIRGRVKTLAIPVLGTIGPLPPVSLNIPGLDVQLSIPLDLSDVVEVKTRDILVPRFGMEYRFPTIQSFWWSGDLDLALRWGYAYHPTPFVPDKGGTNLVDSDTHTASTGFGMMFNNLFSLDIYGQYQYFTPITVKKESINPGMPFESYTADGHILAGGLSASIYW